MKAVFSHERLGWLLLAVAFLIGCFTLYVNSFADEADNLVVGLLLTRGSVLYRDIFSHHFPFPYYWSAAMISLFGKSIFGLRLSVWVFQILAFGIALWLSDLPLSCGLAALVWSIIRHIYRGNMVLYSMFSGPALVVVFAIALSVAMHRVHFTWKHIVAVGVFSIVSILSDPLAVYPIAIALLYLLVTKPKNGMVASMVIGAGLLSYAAALLASGTLQNFVDDALLFNTQIYAKYTNANPVRIKALLEMAIKGLGIADPSWMNLDPFKAITYTYTDFDRWIFTGFLFRFALILGTVFLTLQKDFRAASFLYLFACGTLVIKEWGFRATGFILIALIGISAIITREWWRESKDKRKYIQITSGVVVGLMVLWLGLRVLTYTFVQQPHELAYEINFGHFESQAAAIKKMTCNQPNVSLAFYPKGVYYRHSAPNERKNGFCGIL